MECRRSWLQNAYEADCERKLLQDCDGQTLLEPVQLGTVVAASENLHCRSSPLTYRYTTDPESALFILFDDLMKWVVVVYVN